MSNRRRALTCLICGCKGQSLVAIQEHAMEEHGYTQEDHRNVTRRSEPDGSFVWTFPDGLDWLRSAADI